MAIQTFELVSPFMSVYAPSKKWNGTPDLLRGQTANRLVAGELLSLDGTGVKRANFDVNANGANKALAACVFPYFSETGRGDIITGGNVPILQHGPFEADTMCFERVGDDTFANSVGQGSLSAGAHANLLTVGARVFAMPVRNPQNGATFDGSNYIIGVGASVGAIADHFCIGRVSRVIGSGATAKIRVIFGIN